MADVDKYKEAERLSASGDVNGACELHLDVCRNGQNDRARLGSAVRLIELLKPVDHALQILKVCEVGIGCAQRVHDALTEAYLMGKNAEFLQFVIGISLISERHALRMFPGWFGFALEKDERRFNELSRKIEESTVEVDDLLSRALAIAESAGSHSTKAHIHASAGRVYSNRYMNQKVEYLKAPIRIPRPVMSLLRPFRLDDYALFTRDERRHMTESLIKCEASYLAAVDASRQDSDESAVAYAYFNLANDLRTAFRFRRAKKYLRLAKELAERSNDKGLLRSIKLLEGRIRQRNRNTPNYLAGERSEMPK